MIRLDAKTEDVVRAIVQLQGGQTATAFETFLDWIKQSQAKQRADNDFLNGNDLYRGQGRSLCLGELLDEVASAEEQSRRK